MACGFTDFITDEVCLERGFLPAEQSRMALLHLAVPGNIPLQFLFFPALIPTLISFAAVAPCCSWPNTHTG